MKNNQPVISIGLPVYNGENFLQEAIESILAQTLTDFELIISDNHSTDKTEEICRKYLRQDKRIRYYRNSENLGAAWNYNQVFKLATGKYFKWASHDDIIAPSYLEQCVRVLEENPLGILVYPKAKIIDEFSQEQEIYTENIAIEDFTPHQRFYQLLETFGWYHGTQIFGVFRRKNLEKTQLIRNYAHSDRVLLAELALQGQFFEVPEFLFYRRVHPQISQRANPNDEKFTVWFDPKNLNKLILPRWKRYLAYISIVSQTPFPAREKILCYLQIPRRFLLSKGLKYRIIGMSGEFIKVIKVIFTWHKKQRNNHQYLR